MADSGSGVAIAHDYIRCVKYILHWAGSELQGISREVLFYAIIFFIRGVLNMKKTGIEKNIENKLITPRDKDFAQWYTDVVRVAKLANYSGVKGFLVYEPNGYAIWERIQAEADAMFKRTGHVNVYMPMLIPEGMLAQEKELVEGFAPEVAWVTEGAGKKLPERLAIRPTSETLFGDYYSKTVESWRDLPKLCNQWCSVVRWEKETRPFLRTREFLWQEGHTAHASAVEAEEETARMLEIYRDLAENYLAMPVISGRKTETEKFAGAEYTTTIEALMYNGVSLQAGTSHYFAQKFAKAYDIKFVNQKSEMEYAHTTSWGISTRLIGGLIMIHGDDKGLVLPPKIAPWQVRIVPIITDSEVVDVSRKVLAEIVAAGIRADIDMSDNTAGYKFAESEVQGVPIRLEIGKKDLANNSVLLVRRDTGEKISVKNDAALPDAIARLLDEVQQNLFLRAKARMDDLTSEAHNMEEVIKTMKKRPGFVHAMWCGDAKCEAVMKEKSGIKSRCIVEDGEKIDDGCVVCGKAAEHHVIWGLQY